MSKEKMEKALKGVKVKGALSKDAVVIFRTTQAEKDEIQATASKLGMSATEYLVSIHRLIKARL